MTPPCSRCHGAPYTSPLPEGWELPGAPLPTCTAEAQWAGEDGNLPGADHPLESSRRSNFENAREERRPFRIDLSAAHLRSDIRLRSAQRRFAAWPWADSPYQAVEVTTSGARLAADWEVQDNALLLGLRELLSIEGLAVDGPLSANASPESIQVGDFGELHLISRVTPSLLFLLDPFMVPRPPMGRDMPSAEQWEACEARIAAGDLEGNCSVPLTYPNHRADPRLDRLLTQYLPEAFLENGRLPTHWNLENFISTLSGFIAARPSDPNTPSPNWLALVEDWVAPGSHIDLEISQLNDLFIPGWLDVGPSRGQARLTYLGEHRFSGALADFEIQLDPIVYPDPRSGENPLLELHNASLYSASSPIVLDGLEIPPGINFEFDAERGEFWVEGNVGVESDLTLPIWGSVELSGELAFRFAWQKLDGVWRPLPGSTHVELRNGEIWEAQTGRPLLTQAWLALSDVHNPFDFFSVDPEGFRFQAQGRWGRDGNLNLDLNLPLPRGVDGGYDFERALLDGPASLSLRFFGTQTYEAQARLQAETNGERYRLHGELDVTQSTGARRRAMIENGEILLDLSRPFRELGPSRLEFRASRLSALGVDLRDLGLQLNAEELSYQEGVFQAAISELAFRANPRGSRSGLLRGPVEIELRTTPTGAMTVVWNGPERRFALDDLDLSFSAQGIRLAPLQSLSARRILDPRVAALGVDGRLRGSLVAELPIDREDWRARGSIRLQGDRDGDVYFLDAAGRRVGAALVRDTRWRFRRIDRVDWERGYALGRFHLDTLLNFSSLLPPFETETASPAYGARGQELRPFEINGVMPYDNQPWGLSGFQNRIVDYLVALCRREPRCREELR